MMVVYFGFILLVAFNKPLLGTLVTEGLSLGMLLGVLVILVAWLLTWFYIRWANTHYDASLARTSVRNAGPNRGPPRSRSCGRLRLERTPDDVVAR